MTRRFPNGGTHLGTTQVPPPEYIGLAKTTRGSEPSQYPEEKKTIVIPLVAASERGRAQTIVLAQWGCRTCLV